MKLIKEILSQLAVDTDLSPALRYYVVDGVCAYFENVKNILSFSPTAIVLSSQKGKVTVSGRGLSIRKYGEGDVIVEGEIAKVGRDDPV